MRYQDFHQHHRTEKDTFSSLHLKIQKEQIVSCLLWISEKGWRVTGISHGHVHLKSHMRMMETGWRRLECPEFLGWHKSEKFFWKTHARSELGDFSQRSRTNRLPFVHFHTKETGSPFDFAGLIIKINLCLKQWSRVTHSTCTDRCFKSPEQHLKNRLGSGERQCSRLRGRQRLRDSSKAKPLLKVRELCALLHLQETAAFHDQATTWWWGGDGLGLLRCFWTWTACSSTTCSFFTYGTRQVWSFSSVESSFRCTSEADIMLNYFFTAV